MKIYVYNSQEQEAFRSCITVLARMKFSIQTDDRERGMIRAVKQSDSLGMYSLLDIQLAIHGQGVRLLVMSNSFSGTNGSFFQDNNYENEFADMFIEALQPSCYDNAFRVREYQPVVAFHG
ncbi:MAG: hypothetical protein IPP86_13355 [Bacteroidetes bacterium]|nr:hypothetical protein [Bacteroidota bacterium]MBL0139496.1 hypothetical protein [Bacteroidota bacterium]